MTHYLFESPVLGLLAAGVIELLTVIVWSMRRDRKSALMLLVGPGVAALFVLLDLLVQTPAEAMEATTRRIVKLAVKEDGQGVIDLLSESFRHKQFVVKAAASPVVRRYLQGPVIESAGVTYLEVSSARKQGGQVGFTVLAVMDPKGPFAAGGLLKSRWLFTYVRDPDGRYRVRDIELESLNDGPGFDIFTQGVPREYY